jgi:hypothetical protein
METKREVLSYVEEYGPADSSRGPETVLRGACEDVPFTFSDPAVDFRQSGPQPPGGIACPGNSVWNGYGCTSTPR